MKIRDDIMRTPWITLAGPNMVLHEAGAYNSTGRSHLKPPDLADRLLAELEQLSADWDAVDAMINEGAPA